MAHTQSVEQLAADLKTAQDALRAIVTILGQSGLHANDAPLETNLHYNIGRARGTAQHALTMSGATR